MFKTAFATGFLFVLTVAAVLFAVFVFSNIAYANHLESMSLLEALNWQRNNYDATNFELRVALPINYMISSIIG